MHGIAEFSVANADVCRFGSRVLDQEWYQERLVDQVSGTRAKCWLAAAGVIIGRWGGKFDLLSPDAVAQLVADVKQDRHAASSSRQPGKRC